MNFRVPLKDKIGNEIMVDMPQQIQCSLRPIQLFEYVYPEQWEDIVLNTLGVNTPGAAKETWFDKDPISPEDGGERTGSFQSGKGIKFHLEALRLLLGAEKCPTPKPEAGSRFIDKQFVNILPIGVRKDLKGTSQLGAQHELV